MYLRHGEDRRKDRRRSTSERENAILTPKLRARLYPVSKRGRQEKKIKERRRNGKKGKKNGKKIYNKGKYVHKQYEAREIIKKKNEQKVRRRQAWLS